MVGVIEGRVDGSRIEPQEPRPQPVVVAVLDDAEIRRRGDDQARAVRAATRSQGRPGARRDLASVTQQRDPLDRGRRLAEQPIELLAQPIEDVAIGRRELGPGGEVAHVAGRHRERVGHQLGQVARALAVEDAGDGGGQEPVGPVVEVERRAHEQQLAERARVERQGDLDRDGLDAIRGRRPRTGARHERSRVERIGRHTCAQCQPVARARVPGQTELREPGRRLRTRRRLDLGRGQQVSERVEVVADPDPPLRARLERCRAATRERIEDDVAWSRVAGDEGVGERRRKARQVRAHRVERMAPQALLVLPLGSERDRRQLERKLERELARGGAPRPCRHGGPEPPCIHPAPIPVGAMGRGV